MTNLEALKKLYAELGGNPSDVADMTTSAEVIGVLNEVAGGGSSEPYIITLAIDSTSIPLAEEKTATCDKTFEEIIDAYHSGKVLYCRVIGSNDEQLVKPSMLTSINDTEDNNNIIFFDMNASVGTSTILDTWKMRIYNNDSGIHASVINIRIKSAT